MKFNDSRSFKAVVLADYFMNSMNYPKLPDASKIYDAISDSGYGIIKMPPLGIPDSSSEAWVGSTVDQIQEYGNRGFKVVLLGMKPLPGCGVWLGKVNRELKGRGLKMPPAKLLTTRQVAHDGASIVKRFLEK